MPKFEITLHRGHKGMGHIEKKVEIVEAKDSEEALEMILESTEGTSWYIEKIEEMK